MFEIYYDSSVNMNWLLHVQQHDLMKSNSSMDSVDIVMSYHHETTKLSMLIAVRLEIYDCQFNRLIN
jgi:hypothetical protein